VTPEVLALPVASEASSHVNTANVPEQNPACTRPSQNTYLNVDHYTEISSAKNLSESCQNAWPSDVSVDSMPLHSPPPVPEWPNGSPISVDGTSNAAIHDRVNPSLLTSVSSSQAVKQQIKSEEKIKSPVKMLDAKFIAELEKHLGKREASANTNPPNSNVVSSSANLHSNIPAKVGTPLFVNTGSVGRSKENESPGTSVIPSLKPPPQSSKVSLKNSPLTSSSK
jgi:hypothetical protein